MANFCGICGAKLDPQSGRCPNCQAQSFAGQWQPAATTMVLSPKEEKKAAKKATGARKSAGRIFKIILLTVLILAVLASVVLGLLVYFKVANIPFVEDTMEIIGIISEEEAKKEHTVEDASDSKMAGSDFNMSDIPEDAVEFNGHYYYIYHLSAVTSWIDAAHYCEERGGYLATVTSAEENAFLNSYLQNHPDYTDAYFGLTDQDEEGTWQWQNGEPVSYTNWNAKEPNNTAYKTKGPENYGMYFHQYTDGGWNDANFGDVSEEGKCGFICEWGEYLPNTNKRDIVLVLDASGSMEGTPMEETKKASAQFVDTVLEKDARIGIVSYESEAVRNADFTTDKSYLKEVIDTIGGDGETNIEAGLSEAWTMLNDSNAEKKIIVLMSDGMPNHGKTDDALISFAEEIKESGVVIYTLGFFEEMYDDKSDAQNLMEHMASDGYHYEVSDSDDLIFFFDDVADQINGQKYIYIRIACPVTVCVSYNGEVLASDGKEQNFRTSFGTLSFEENEKESAEQEDDSVKVLRLKEGAAYDIEIEGTGSGRMDYTIGFMDANGVYNDFRRFENIRITKRTRIDTVAAVSEKSTLNIDKDGDGKYDIRLRAGANGHGEEVSVHLWLYVVLGGTLLLVLLVVLIAVQKSKKKKQARMIQ